MNGVEAPGTVLRKLCNNSELTLERGKTYYFQASIVCLHQVYISFSSIGHSAGRVYDVLNFLFFIQSTGILCTQSRPL